MCFWNDGTTTVLETSRLKLVDAEWAEGAAVEFYPPKGTPWNGKILGLDGKNSEGEQHVIKKDLNHAYKKACSNK